MARVGPSLHWVAQLQFLALQSFHPEFQTSASLGGPYSDINSLPDLRSAGLGSDGVQVPVATASLVPALPTQNTQLATIVASGSRDPIITRLKGAKRGVVACQLGVARSRSWKKPRFASSVLATAKCGFLGSG